MSKTLKDLDSDESLNWDNSDSEDSKVKVDKNKPDDTFFNGKLHHSGSLLKFQHSAIKLEVPKEGKGSHSVEIEWDEIDEEDWEEFKKKNDENKKQRRIGLSFHQNLKDFADDDEFNFENAFEHNEKLGGLLEKAAEGTMSYFVNSQEACMQINNNIEIEERKGKLHLLNEEGKVVVQAQQEVINAKRTQFLKSANKGLLTVSEHTTLVLDLWTMEIQLADTALTNSIDNLTKRIRDPLPTKSLGLFNYNSWVKQCSQKLKELSNDVHLANVNATILFGDLRRQDNSIGELFDILEQLITNLTSNIKKLASRTFFGRVLGSFGRSSGDKVVSNLLSPPSSRRPTKSRDAIGGGGSIGNKRNSREPEARETTARTFNERLLKRRNSFSKDLPPALVGRARGGSIDTTSMSDPATPVLLSSTGSHNGTNHTSTNSNLSEHPRGSSPLARSPSPLSPRSALLGQLASVEVLSNPHHSEQKKPSHKKSSSSPQQSSALAPPVSDDKQKKQKKQKKEKKSKKSKSQKEKPIEAEVTVVPTGFKDLEKLKAEVCKKANVPEKRTIVEYFDPVFENWVEFDNSTDLDDLKKDEISHYRVKHSSGSSSSSSSSRGGSLHGRPRVSSFGSTNSDSPKASRRDSSGSPKKRKEKSSHKSHKSSKSDRSSETLDGPFNQENKLSAISEIKKTSLEHLAPVSAPVSTPVSAPVLTPVSAPVSAASPRPNNELEDLRRQIEQLRNENLMLRAKEQRIQEQEREIEVKQKQIEMLLDIVVEEDMHKRHIEDSADVEFSSKQTQESSPEESSLPPRESKSVPILDDPSPNDSTDEFAEPAPTETAPQEELPGPHPAITTAQKDPITEKKKQPILEKEKEPISEKEKEPISEKEKEPEKDKNPSDKEQGSENDAGRAPKKRAWATSISPSTAQARNSLNDSQLFIRYKTGALSKSYSQNDAQDRPLSRMIGVGQNSLRIRPTALERQSLYSKPAPPAPPSNNSNNNNKVLESKLLSRSSSTETGITNSQENHDHASPRDSLDPNKNEKPFYEGLPVYAFETLSNRLLWTKLPIKKDKREFYLSDEQFKEIFGMDKASYVKLREWKKTELKRSVRLF